MDTTEKKDFNPYDYLTPPQPAPVKRRDEPQPGALQDRCSEADAFSRAKGIVGAVTRSGTDLTGGYDNWLTVGLALANDLGEAGRGFFHELSQMNAQYACEECDKKYTSLLKGTATRPEGSRVHLGTLCKMAADAGVKLPSRGDGAHKGGVARVARVAGEARGNGSEGYKAGSGVAGGVANDGGVADAIHEGENIGLFDYMPDKPSTFSDLIKTEQLPYIARQAVELAAGDTESADVNLLGIVTIASSIMPGVYGVYDRQKVYPSLYTMCVAPPASSKGHITPMREFVMPVQEEIRQDNMREMEEYKKEASAMRILGKEGQDGGSSCSQEPPYRSLFVPANSSSTATYQALSDNGGAGLTFETEGAVMAEALKSDYGNYLSGLCAAFHHEPISYNRRKDKEHVDIRAPRWTVFLTGYPEMVRALVPDSHTGLFSRFLFYWRSTTLVWRNVFVDDAGTLDDAYRDLGQRYLPIYHLLAARRAHPVRFTLTDRQKDTFNSFFERLQEEQHSMLGDDIIASVRRLGLIAFRIAMVLTVMHLADGDEAPGEVAELLTCDDADFITAMTMVNKLLNHTTKVYSLMLDHDVAISLAKSRPASPAEQAFFDALPDVFNTDIYKMQAKMLNVTARTAQRYLAKLTNEAHMLERVKTGVYRKIKTI